MNRLTHQGSKAPRRGLRGTRGRFGLAAQTKFMPRLSERAETRILWVLGLLLTFGSGYIGSGQQAIFKQLARAHIHLDGFSGFLVWLPSYVPWVAFVVFMVITAIIILRRPRPVEVPVAVSPDLLAAATREAAMAGLRDRAEAAVRARDEAIKQRDDVIRQMMEAKAATLPSHVATNIRLQFYPGNTTPTAVSFTNIWRYFTLRNLGNVDELGKIVQRTVRWDIYLVFDKPVRFKEITLNAIGVNLPLYEVKDSGPRHAFIVIEGDIPGAVLDINAVL